MSETIKTIETTLGKLINQTTSRDAIHIAVAPVKATCTLKPGQHIGFVDNTNQNVGYTDGIIPRTIKFIGIVDPFLTEPVKENEWFYMLLYPKTITGLKHVWTHPEFHIEDNNNEIIAGSKKESELWLRFYIKNYGGDYNDVIEAVKNKGSACFGRDLNYEDFNEYDSEFWKHIQIVLGENLSDEHKETVTFRCAC